MKIAVLHNIPIHYKHLLFQSMKKQGLDFKVFFAAAGSPIRLEAVGLSQDLYRFAIGFNGPYEDAPRKQRAHWAWKSLDHFRPDAILTCGYHSAESWAAWFWSRLNRKPIVMWYESNEFDHKRRWPKEALKRIFLSGCSGAHVYGNSNKDYLIKLGMPPENILIKRAVVDIEKFATTQSIKEYRRGGVTTLVFVGRLVQDKNPVMLIRAFARAAKKQQLPTRLVIAGVGPCETRMKQEAAALGIENLVEFKGYVPQGELASVYREADFFVLPSVLEPWGLVALEAMLCRLPVLISTQCGCAVDVVTQRTGWKFSPWDEEGLTSLISQLPLIRTQELRRMGDAAFDIAKTYSADNCAEVIAKSMPSLARGHQRLCTELQQEGESAA